MTIEAFIETLASEGASYEELRAQVRETGVLEPFNAFIDMLTMGITTGQSHWGDFFIPYLDIMSLQKNTTLKGWLSSSKGWDKMIARAATRGEDEKIEVKCTQFNGHGAATKWSGGANIRNGKYLLIAHDLDFENMFVAFTDLDTLDWGNPDINSKKTMKLSTWFENHKDDAEIWKGGAQLIKTNKMPEGQVQMTLSAILEPINK